MSDDLRSALTEAFEKAPDTVTEVAPVEVAPEVEAAPAEVAPVETAAEAAARIRDEKGRFAPKTAATATPKAPEAAATPAPATAAATPTTPPKEGAPTATPAPEFRAPQSWKPEARETWAKLPVEAQREIARREKEIATALQESAPARKFQESFNAVVSPYAAMLQAEGSDPIKATQSLFNTAYVLRSAPVPQKAQLVAQMMQQFGIPVEALADAIDGKAPTQGQPQAPTQHAPPEYRDPRVDLIFQQAQAKLAQTVQQEVLSVQNEEFFEDVRGTMAKLAAAGFSSSAKELYTQACKLSPEVSRVLQQREEAKALANAQASTAKAKAAASSIRSQPSLTGGPQKDDVRSLLEAHWNG